MGLEPNACEMRVRFVWNIWMKDVISQVLKKKENSKSWQPSSELIPKHVECGCIYGNVPNVNMQ